MIKTRRKTLRHEVINLENIKLTSVNQKYLTGRFILTKNYRDMKDLLSRACKKVKIDPPYRVEIYLKTYLDADNIVKLALDSLDNCITNDREVLELFVKKEKTKRGKLGSIKILVESLSGS